MSVIDNFDSWKDFLGDRLHDAQNNGISNAAISELAYDIGSYLSTEVQAKNDQEKMLRDLWNAADQKEQHAIANIMVKLVQNEGSK
ncbi:DUF3243 domain-containing protein [Gracilibacillus salinarum]|uniref:DUF3243 domain-containing protein n=1 Tax=Gracilibacillus salinarum TaxID=2932255 RepID=A0ABY4GN70_9BACI|nr:DUF3243 domain-containing protein [Gracilibacillus salinarum]UOQ85638.1 DUF3243 domain-containing protein [Gracilibacillus salinarum]